MKPNTKKALVLFSGGIDSTACIQYYKTKGFQVDATFIDFGQLSARREYNAVRRISTFYNIKPRVVHVRHATSFKGGEISLRNIFFVSTALLGLKNYQGLIGLGIHSGTDYADCSPSFVKLTNSILDLYTSGKVILEAPFLNFNKYEILQYCQAGQIPLNLTYSCELGLDQPCGKCLSCKSLKKIYDRENIDS